MPQPPEPYYDVRHISELVRVLTPRNVPTLECFVYAMPSAEGTVLIDCGSGEMWDALVRSVARAGLPPVTSVLLTHCHIDHAGGAARAAAAGARVHAHARAVDALLAEPRRVCYEAPDLVERPDPAALTRIDPGRPLVFDDLCLDVLATPGHTADHLAFANEETEGWIVFSGALVTPEGDPGWAGSDDFDADALRASIQRVLGLIPPRLMGGHWVMRDACQILVNALDRAAAGAWRLDRHLHYETFRRDP